MRYISTIFIALFLCLTSYINAQDLEELKKQLSSKIQDTTRLSLLVDISNECDYDEISFYANQAIKLADSIVALNKYDENDLLSKKATAINNLAFLYHNSSNYEKAQQAYEKSLKIFEQIQDTNGIIMSYNNISMLLKDMGKIDLTIEYLDKAHYYAELVNSLDLLHMTYTNYSAIYIRTGLIEKALEYSYKGLKIQEQLGDEYGKGYALNNIGSLFYMQEDYENAKKYFLKSLELRQKTNDQIGVSAVLNNLSKTYGQLGDEKKSEEYLFKCLEKRKEIKNPEGVAQSYSNIGGFYFDRGNLQKAKDYYDKAIVMREKIGDMEGLSNSYSNMATLFLAQGKYKESEKYALKAMKISKELGFNNDIESTAKVLSDIYEKTGNYRKAFDFYKLHNELKDSLFNQETQKSLLSKQINYEYEKKKLKDSLEFAREQEIKDLAIAKQEAQLKQEKTQRLALYGGLFIIVIFSGFVYNRFRISQKQKKIIELQKVEVEQQKEVVEEKNREIMDSIHYAKRIQAAILPPDKSVKEHLPNSFILYKPKDIVAGDFYWLETISSSRHSVLDTESLSKTKIADQASNDELILFAACDCTGHGVPGAMVSVVCNNGLNRSVREHGLTVPGEILNKTREIVIAEFEKSEDDVKDGMDIALCSLKQEDRGWKLQYAGANNPLWILRKSESSKVESNQGEVISYELSTFNFILYELKPDKQPIGKFAEQNPYTTHTLELQKGDTIYVFSDGYADQFGGEKGKKFKSANFKKLLLSIQHENMETQKQIINNTFEEWKGEIEQIDDVCIIGVRV